MIQPSRIEPVLGDGSEDRLAAAADARRAQATAGERDLVCGLFVDPAVAVRVEHGGQGLYFCGAECAAKFRAEPVRYLHAAAHVSPSIALPAQESAVPDDTGPRDSAALAWVLVLAAIVCLMSSAAVASFFGEPAWWIPAGWIVWGLQSAGLARVVLGAWPRVPRAVAAPVFALWLFAYGIAAAAAALGLAWPPSAALGWYALDDLADASVLGAALALCAHWQALAWWSARRHETALGRMAPKGARRVTPAGGEEAVPVERLTAGDVVRVGPGERVPIDGVVLQGRSHVDESGLTGTIEVAAKAAGSTILAGAVNHEGTLLIRGEVAGRQTVYARLIRRMVTWSESLLPAAEGACAAAGWFIPLYLLVAVIMATVWLLAPPHADPTPAVEGGLALWAAAVPGLAAALLALAGRLAVDGALGEGILADDGTALERLGAIRTLVLAPTLRQSDGPVRLARWDVVGTRDGRELMALAAGLCQRQDEPEAQVLAREAAARAIAPAAVSAVQSLPGRGVKALYRGQSVAFGGRGLLDDLGVAVPAGLAPEGAPTTEEGVRYLVVGHTCRARLEVRTESSARSERVLRALADLGVAAVWDDQAPPGDGVQDSARHALRRRDRAVAVVAEGPDRPRAGEDDVQVAIVRAGASEMPHADLLMLRPGLSALPRVLVLGRRLRRARVAIVAFALLYALAAALATVPLPWLGALLPFPPQKAPWLAAVAGCLAWWAGTRATASWIRTPLRAAGP